MSFVHRSPTMTEELFNQIIAAIIAQATFIGRHLSKFSSANNHLIGEAASLAFAGLTLPWLRQAKSWQKQGLKILTEEIEKQIYPDGVMAEQAVSYLAFDLDFYLLVWQAAVLNGVSIPTVWRERLGAACEFVGHIMDENGQVPAIGDSEFGRLMYPTGTRYSVPLVVDRTTNSPSPTCGESVYDAHLPSGESVAP
jgi:hypothetical protein